MTKKPVLLRGMALSAGYLWAAIRRAERPIPRELLDFRRKEQMDELARRFLRRPAPQAERPAATHIS
jgi:hypothetical protein